MDGSSNAGSNSNEGVDLPLCCSKFLYEWIVFRGLIVVDGVGKFDVAVGDFYELYDVWWCWCWGGGRYQWGHA